MYSKIVWDDARKKSAYTNDIKYVQQNDPPPPFIGR